MNAYIQLIPDFGLSTKQLEAKYDQGGDGVHPVFQRRAWRAAVTAERTICGYWHWVEYQLQLAQDELDRDNPYNPYNQEAL